MGAVSPYWLLSGALLIALVPIGFGLATPFLKISIVLGVLRNGLGTQQVPSTLIVTSIALGLTLVTMAPVFQKCSVKLRELPLSHFNQDFTAEKLKQIVPLLTPWQEFLTKHAGAREVQLLAKLISGEQHTAEAEQGHAEGTSSSLAVILGAFVLSELKEGFAMAFMLLLPFLIIDLVVANILAGLGMYMVSPVLISLPLKLIVFVLADGWLLIGQSLIASYQ